MSGSGSSVSNSPGLGAPAFDPREAAASAWSVALYELRRLRRGRHALGRLALVGAPVAVAVLMGLIWSAVASDLFVEPLVVNGERRPAGSELVFLAQIFRFFDLALVVYLAAASLFSNLYHAEIADRTLHHVFLMPVRREIITIGKYVAAVLTLLATTLAAWLATMAILLAYHGPEAALRTALSVEGVRHVASYAVMLLLAALAYGAMFLLVGALTRAPIVVAGVFFGWEWLTLFLPTSIKRLTLVHWIGSFLPASVSTDGILSSLGDPESPVVALLVLLAFSAACLAAATWRSRRLQVSYGASE